MRRRAYGLVLGLCAFVLFLTMFGAALNVPLVWSEGIIYILPNGALSPSTASITTIDNVTYTFTGNVSSEIIVQRNNIIVDGNGYTLQSPQFGTVVDGLSLSGVSNVTIRNTSITGFIVGIYLVSSSDNNVLTNNNVTANDYGIWLGGSSGNVLSSNVVKSNIGYGILLNSSSDHNSFTGNNVTANDYGIWLGLSQNNSFSFNNITANQFGIWLSTSDNNNFFGNDATDNKNCIYLEGSSGNTLSGNNVTANVGYGIQLDDSSNNILSANIMNNNLYGAYFLSSSNDTLSGNNIANNGYGIYLGSSSDNIFSDNTFSTNREVAIEFYSSSDNNVFHNNFKNNTNIQIYVEGLLNNSINSWDEGYPSGGNYWSDYQGTDSFSGPHQNEPGSDGIGDTPYIINAVESDNYPLLGNFSEFSVFSEEPVQVTSNSTLSGFTFNGSAISFIVNGPSGTSGFCMIRIPTALMSVPYRVYVNDTEIQYTLLAYSNLTYSYLYFNYTHSTDRVTVVPDFQSPIILLLMLTTVAAVTTFRKQHQKQTET